MGATIFQEVAILAQLLHNGNKLQTANRKLTHKPETTNVKRPTIPGFHFSFAINLPADR